MMLDLTPAVSKCAKVPLGPQELSFVVLPGCRDFFGGLLVVGGEIELDAAAVEEELDVNRASIPAGSTLRDDRQTDTKKWI
ncbi:hypothetical protein DPM13_07855 [Paracoccus mutanolyticus]|uniref:Uncharacterized protein n=2 Tax=Paracoccus mutanolyticus TaxID=1499308 RepID=A0ABM6WRD7_9RHOB|nr:hypothetical protein DPM13_07855 [Paracoccus mutanolyticus]